MSAAHFYVSEKHMVLRTVFLAVRAVKKGRVCRRFCSGNCLDPLVDSCQLSEDFSGIFHLKVNGQIAVKGGGDLRKVCFCEIVPLHFVVEVLRTDTHSPSKFRFRYVTALYK